MEKRKRKKRKSRTFRAVHVLFIFGFIISTQCSIIIPPVTITGTRTATEKQIVGDEKYIEEDAWLIASARTTKKDRSDEQGKTPDQIDENKRIQINLYRALRTFEFFEKDILEYRNDGIVGENKDGFIEIVTAKPKESILALNINPLKGATNIFSKTKERKQESLEDSRKKYLQPKLKKRLEVFIEKMNLARQDFIKSSIASLDPNIEKADRPHEIEQLNKSIKSKFLAELSLGHWFEKEDGEWEQLSNENQFEIE